VLLVTGPVGVGKQRLALWLAQLIFCERPTAGGEPCDACRHCRLTLDLAHPDLHWIVPIPRPKAGEPDKMVDEAAEALAAVMAERRADPLWAVPDGMASHGIASVRLLQRRAALTSVEGGRKVFIIGDAERLVPQESSQEAANALLKLLEEPPADSTFILTATDARRLLPTIRSRAVPLRVGRLADAEVRSFVESRKPGTGGAALDARVRAAEGAIGRALGEGDGGGAAHDAAGALLDAALGGPGGRLERALKQNPFSARGDFSAMLDALAETMGEAARAALGERVRRPLPPALRQPREPEAYLAAQDSIARAREAAAGNVNPQLLLAVLLDELATELAEAR
jgi:DNA polymerase III subunit delta'